MKRTLNDEWLLTDYVLDRCDAPQRQEVEARLKDDRDFQAQYEDIKALCSTVSLLPSLEPPEDLVSDTLSRISQKRRTDALLARESLGRPPVLTSFNLRDIAAVAAVVALLATVFVPTFRKASRVADASQCAANLGRLSAAMHAYAADHQQELPAVQAGNNAWLAGDSESASNSQALFKLVSGGYADPDVFKCPGSEKSASGKLAVRAGMIDFPHEQYVNYSYQHTIGHGLRLDDPNLSRVASNMAILADSTPLFEGGRFIPERLENPTSMNHDRVGQNVLYMDGHVSWRDTARAGVNGDHIYLANGIQDYRGDERPATSTDTFLLPAYSR